MNATFRDLLGFLGYGNPKNTIWFFAHEEHGGIMNHDEGEWKSWVDEKCTSSPFEIVSIEDPNIPINNTVPIRWNPWEPGGEAEYPPYMLCARAVEALESWGRSENTWDSAFLVNILPIPHINEGNGMEWDLWLKSKLGVEEWDVAMYNENVTRYRRIILLQAARHLTPSAIVVMGNRAMDFVSEGFRKELRVLSPQTCIVTALCHMGRRARNILHIPEDVWIDHIVTAMRECKGNRTDI